MTDNIQERLEQAEERVKKELRRYANPIKLFGKWEMAFFEKKVKSGKDDEKELDQITMPDDSLSDQVTLDPIVYPHTGGRWQKKRFRKIQCPIVERFTNCLMMHGRNSGKKLKALTTVKQMLEIIHVMENRNPVQVLIDAIANGGPREDSTRVGSAGVVRRQAVDVSPLRRINQSIAIMIAGARRNAFRNIKSLSECLADEVILCSKNSANSFAIKKKTETERVAASNR